MVFPNRITVPLTDIDPYELKYPLPDASDLYLSLEFSLGKADRKTKRKLTKWRALLVGIESFMMSYRK